MNCYFSDLWSGGKSLLIGLGVTFKAMVSPVVTVQYPREKIRISPNMRGHIQLVKDPETGGSRCISCGMCAKNCPGGCIKIASEKQEGVKGKVLVSFMLDFTTCSLCALCVESCRPQALEFSNEYEIAGCSREDFVFDLVKRLEDQA